MKANITLEDIYYNSNLKNFLFRSQSFSTLKELLERSEIGEDETLKTLDDKLFEDDFDEIEEQFYNDSVEEIASYYNIELNEA